MAWLVMGSTLRRSLGILCDSTKYVFLPLGLLYTHRSSVIDSSLTTPSQLISDAVKRSSLAHLFHFYPVLCEIASVPRRTPSTWVMARSNSPIRTDFSSIEKTDDEVVELDARVLARQCLQELGREMGVV